MNLPLPNLTFAVVRGHDGSEMSVGDPAAWLAHLVSEAEERGILYGVKLAEERKVHEEALVDHAKAYRALQELTVAITGPATRWERG